MTWARAKIYKKDLLTPRPCKKCGQFMSYEVCLNNYNKKSANQKAAMALAKKYGERIGRPTQFDEDIIKEYLAAGHTYRQIATTLGCSTSVISRVVKKYSLSNYRKFKGE